MRYPSLPLVTMLFTFRSFLKYDDISACRCSSAHINL